MPRPGFEREPSFDIDTDEPYRPPDVEQCQLVRVNGTVDTLGCASGAVTDLATKIDHNEFYLCV